MDDTAAPAHPMDEGASSPWLPLCQAADVEPEVPVRVEREGLPVLAVFRLEDGSLHVTDDTCTHGQASLSDGFVLGDEIECPWHAGKFCIRDGRATGLPAVEPIRVYPARVIDGRVCIAAPSPAG
jgi:nitrite reductase/ring-hydroxylating ferredoxin subunit